MDKNVDNFSKDLANGVSYRRAFFKLMFGAGLFGFLTRGTPKANAAPPPSNCESYCLNLAGEVYDRCIFEGKSESYCFYNVLGPAYDCCVRDCEHTGPKGCQVNATEILLP
jgi:hypothetical protein